MSIIDCHCHASPWELIRTSNAAFVGATGVALPIDAGFAAYSGV